MDLIPAIASFVAAVLFTPLFLALMRRSGKFRYRAESGKSLPELAAEYGPYERLSTLLSILLMALIAGPLWFGLDLGYSQHLASLPSGRFLLALPPILWLLPALFVALFVSALPLRFLLTRALGSRRYAEFVEYNDRKHGVDSWRLYRYLAYVLLPLCLILTLMAFDSYTRIDEKGIVVNEYLGFGERFYRFEEVEAIWQIATGRDETGAARPHFVIRFRDGREFDFYRSLLELDRGQQRAIIEYLQAATDLRLVPLDAGSA